MKMERLALHLPLGAALAALLFAKHTAFGEDPVSLLQLAGMGLICLVWVSGLLAREFRVDRSLFVALLLALILACAFGGGFAFGLVAPCATLGRNFFNSVTVLVAFPVAVMIGRRLDAEELARVLVLVSLAVVVTGAFIAKDLTASYVGDTRDVRTTLGFAKPTFLAETALIVVFSCRMQRHRGLGVLVTLAALAAIYASGSRTALAVALAFLGYGLYGVLRRRTRGALLATAVLLVPVGLVLAYMFVNVDRQAIDLVTSGRLSIWTAELRANLRGLQWLFGNFSATEVYSYANERTNSAYHVDSFYLERLIVTGALGLALVAVSVGFFLRRLDGTGRAIVVACMVYGLAENTVFNLTSAFAFFPLMLAATRVARSPVLERGCTRACMRDDMHAASA